MNIDWENLQPHPLAALFPPLNETEFEELADDIADRGLIEPLILTSDGTMIVDGLNRLRACLERGVDPHAEILHKAIDPARVIVSANVRRRNLTPQQRAVIALQFLEYAETEAHKRNTGRPKEPGAKLPQVPRAPRARDEVAKQFNVSARYIQDAKLVKDHAPELLTEVSDGTTTLKDATKTARQRKQTTTPDPTPKPTAVTIKLQRVDGTTIDHPKPQNVTYNRTKGDGISWADWSWNPVTGCEHSCTYCYAREIANNPRFANAYPLGFEPLFHPERLTAPTNTHLPKTETLTSHNVFVCSMADLFGKWVPDEWINQVLDTCRTNPQWRYLFLTKFPSRYKGLTFPPKAWVGTSVDTQRRVDIAMHSMANVEAEVKWLSLEPLLEPLHFDSLAMFDWIVIGAQTSTAAEKAKAPNFEWVADLVAQARRDGVAVHLKPNLNNSPGMTLPNEYPPTIT